jgi:hypothetical protein
MLDHLIIVAASTAAAALAGGGQRPQHQFKRDALMGDMQSDEVAAGQLAACSSAATALPAY